MFSEKMSLLELFVMKQDIDPVLGYLGTHDCLQLSRTDPLRADAGGGERAGQIGSRRGVVSSTARNELEAVSAASAAQKTERPVRGTELSGIGGRAAELLTKLENVRAYLEPHRGRSPDVLAAPAGAADARRGRPDRNTAGTGETGGTRFALPAESEYRRADEIIDLAGALVREEQELASRRLQIEQALKETAAFVRLGMPWSEIEHLTFLTVRVGKLDSAVLPALSEALGSRALVIPAGAPDEASGRIIAVSTKKGRFALDTELKKAGFRDTPYPEQYPDVPSVMARGLEDELHGIEKRLVSLEERRRELAGAAGPELSILIDRIGMASVVEEVKEELQSSASAYRILGWIPDKAIDETIESLDRITGSRIAVRAYRPYEVRAIREGRGKVPVKLTHGKFVRAFEGLVFSYGAPLYGTIDPTLFVAFLFVLLFSIMFGDVGQGAIGVLIGVLLTRESIASLRKFRKFGVIFIAVGIGSMITGFLYGSVFSNETLLVPVTRAITEFLTGTPRDRFVTIMPTEGLGQLFAFFGFTIGIGVLVNSTGLVINIYNQFALRNRYKAIFTKTGIAGLALFWYVVFIAVRAVAGGTLYTWDAAGVAVPLLLIFFGEPIYRLAAGKRPVFHEGLMPFVMEGFVELLESISYFLSSSVSFLRVAAFALAHAVLSLIVFSLSEMLSGPPVGFVFGTIVMILGNALIIVLEGLIVSIQVVRLQYYEFFSKFFVESGEAWKPFSFGTRSEA